MTTPNTKARPVTLARLRRMKDAAEPIVCLTAYDHTFAHTAAAAGVDVLLVGDTLGMVIQGHETTLPVSVDDVVYHTRWVARGAGGALVMADMPFMSYADEATALASAARLVKEGGAQVVKLEGTADETAVVRALSRAGVPVCAHLGLRPQLVNKIGGYRVQGKDEASAAAMLEDAQALEAAGADLMLVECIPAALAARLTAALRIPVIGIGAGAACDGQILVLQDVLGITPGGGPRFAKDFAAGAGSIAAALEGYVRDVRSGRFPSADHGF